MIDTSLGAPEDIAAVENGPEVTGSTYVVNPHTVIMLHYGSHAETSGEPEI